MAYQPDDQRPASLPPPPAGGIPVWVVVLVILFMLIGLAAESLVLLGIGAGGAIIALLVQVSRLQERTQRLHEQLSWLTDYVNELGQKQPVQPMPVPAAPPVEVAPPVAPPVAPVQPPEAVQPPPWQPQAPTAPPPPAPFDWDGLWRSLAGPIAGLAAGSGDVRSAEARIGTVWLSRIGMLLILVSAVVGYLMLKNTALQAGIGWVAGLALIGLGWWGHRKGYGPWSQAVSGGGVGLLYLVTTASATVLKVLPVPAAFGLMVVITALGTFLAVFYDSIAVGVLAMVGGFATPFLLSSGQGSYAVLFTYVAILDLGLLGVAWFKRWPLYNYLLFVATWLTYGTWRAAAYTPADRYGAFGFASLFFLIFAGVAIQYNILHREKSRYQDLGVVLANGFIFFGSGLELLPGGPGRALFAFTMAFVHLGLGYLTLRRNAVDRLMRLSFYALAGIFVTIAFPVALHGPWIAVAWALEAASLVWIGFLAAEPWARLGGLGVFALALARLLVWETWPRFFDMTLPGPMLRGFTFVLSVVAFYLAVWAYRRFRGDQRVLAGLAVAANFLTLWYMTFEITLAYGGVHRWAQGGRIAGHEGLVIAAAWGLYGLLIALAERRFSHAHVRRGSRFVLLAALLYLVLGAMIADARWSWSLPVYRYTAYTAVLGGTWAAEYLFRRYEEDRERNGWLSLAAALLGFGVGGFEVVRWVAPLKTPGYHTAAWFQWYDSTRTFWMVTVGAAYALVLMLVGSWLRSGRTRLLAALLSAVALGYLLFGGVPNLAAAPGVRLLAFVMAVPGTWLAVWLGFKATGERLPSEAIAFRTLGLAAAGLTAVWGAFEVAAPLRGQLQLYAVMIWGGLYGLIVLLFGILLRSWETRLLGFTILSVATLLLAPAGLNEWPGVPAHGAVRAFAWLSTIGSLYASAWLVRLAQPWTVPNDLVVTEWAAMGGAMLTLGWIGLEVSHLTVAGATVHHFILSAVLGGYGFLVLAAGFLLRHRKTRLMALGIVALVILKIALYDMWQLEVIWRFWIGVAIGSMMLIASLAYQRFVKVIMAEDK